MPTIYRLVGDLQGEAFKSFLLVALKTQKYFTLIWRDFMSEEADRVRASLKHLELWERQTNRWPGTGTSGQVTAVAFRCDPSALKILSQPGHLFALSPNYPEDLAFSGESGVSFLSVTHEKYAWFASLELMTMLKSIEVVSEECTDHDWQLFFSTDAAECLPLCE